MGSEMCIRDRFGTFDAPYDPKAGMETIKDDNGVILLRRGYLHGRDQATINMLEDFVIQRVDQYHDDYSRLVDAGVIQETKTKKDKP